MKTIIRKLIPRFVLSCSALLAVYPGTYGQPDSAYRLVKTYINPVLPGDHPDITLFKDGDDFYECNSSFHFAPYGAILHSTDLVHWEVISRVISPGWSGLLNDDPSAGIWAGVITFFYGSYWFYFANTAGGGQYFCKADSPSGPWSQPVRMNVTASTGYSGYDNSIFVDNDGTPYMLIKPGQYVNRIQEIGTDGHLTGTVINMDWVNADGRYSWAEGPVMCKKDGWYYYFVAGNVYGGQYVLRSQELTGDSDKWEALGDFFAPSEGSVYLGRPNHISQPFELEDGTWWCLAHSYESISGDNWEGQGRQGVLHQVTWNASGKPVGSAPTSSPVAVPDLPKSGIPWLLPRSDYFDGNELKLCWHFLDKNAPYRVSLEAKPGWLRLDPNAGKTHILQKEAGHYYTLVTRVGIDAVEEGQQAGIYLTNGNESVTVRLASGYADGKKIMFDFLSTSYEADNNIGDSLWLKIERTEHHLNAYYGPDGVHWTRVGDDINVYELDMNQPDYNSWVGTSIGMYAKGTTADFDLFLYKDGFSEQPVSGYNNAFGIAETERSAGSVVYNTSESGGWLMLGGMDLGRGKRIPAGIEVLASSVKSGNLEVWIDDLEHEGTKIATIPIGITGSVNTFKTFSADVSGVSGQHDVFLRYSGDKNAFYVHTIRFIPDPALTEGTGSKTGFGNDSFMVYPNPSDGLFNIDCREKAVDYAIYSLTGTLIEQNELNAGKNGLGRTLVPGMYFLELSSDRTSSTIRIVKCGR